MAGFFPKLALIASDPSHWLVGLSRALKQSDVQEHTAASASIQSDVSHKYLASQPGAEKADATAPSTAPRQRAKATSE